MIGHWSQAVSGRPSSRDDALPSHDFDVGAAVEALFRVLPLRSYNGTISAGHSSCTLPVTATAVINTVAKLSTTSLTTTLSAPNAIDFGVRGRHVRGTDVHGQEQPCICTHLLQRPPRPGPAPPGSQQAGL